MAVRRTSADPAPTARGGCLINEGLVSSKTNQQTNRISQFWSTITLYSQLRNGSIFFRIAVITRRGCGRWFVPPRAAGRAAEIVLGGSAGAAAAELGPDLASSLYYRPPRMREIHRVGPAECASRPNFLTGNPD
jgi:hypothetical protein